jgi:soluble lytic murein transglycosylase
MAARAAKGRRTRRLRPGFLVFLALLVGGPPAGYGFLRLLYPFPYREVITQEAQRNDLDPLFVAAVMRVESGFSPTARSAVGARGLMQLMPTTARWVARKAAMSDFSTDQLEDPATNIRLGCWYLAYLDRQFPGQPELVLAAYNAGEGNVGRWRQSGDAVLSAFPETRRYVQRGLRTYRIYRFLYRPWGS